MEGMNFRSDIPGAAARKASPSSRIHDAEAIDRRSVTIETADGFPLGGTVFEGDGDGPLVLISSATAVPQRLYAGFAELLMRKGARAVLTYDYRATGKSPRPDGWTARINYKDWALIDFPAALQALEATAPGHPVVGVGQSYGGHALGLSGVANRFQRHAMVATMTAYVGLLDDRWAWPRMNLLGVPTSYLFRDTPRWLGIGEPIPSSCFRDWARWCRMPNYFFDDPDLPETARFSDVRIPILAVGLTDDRWATPRAVDHFMARHPDADVEQRWLSPNDAGGSTIGHLGFFRSRFAGTLWPALAHWLLTGEAMMIGAERPPQKS